MSTGSSLTTPQDDADRIRMRRLQKLQDAAPARPPSAPSASSSSAPSPVPSSPKPQPPKRPVVPPTPPQSSTSASTPLPAKKPRAPLHLDIPSWFHESATKILGVTLDKAAAEKSGYELVWLKSLSAELASEGVDVQKIDDSEMLSRLIIARLEVDPNDMTDDLEYMPVLASLPAKQTVFEYLVGAWKRLNSTRALLIKKGYIPGEAQAALEKLDKLKELIISYAGFSLQEPEMFPQPTGRQLGAIELVEPLMSLSALSAPLLGSSTSAPNKLGPSDIDQFLGDLARRFEPDEELDGILGPVVRQLLHNPILIKPEGLGGGDAGWRGIISGLEALVSVKPIAIMITRLEEWNPSTATPPTFEYLSLMGPLCRLGVFPREWPGIAKTYFSEPDKKTRGDVESSNASLRGTLKTLQGSLFGVFNALVRASPQSREAVLSYFARVVSLNAKRAGMQVDPNTVATDSFMFNMSSVLLQFAEPFIDANYTKMDRIDPTYFAKSERIDLKEETRIKATSNEAVEWEEANKGAPGAPPPNFISDIFYLTVAMAHYGYLQTISYFGELQRGIDDVQRQIDYLQGDGSWMGTPQQARREAQINTAKAEQNRVRSAQFAYQTQLLDPEFVVRNLGFINFLSTWLIRMAEPSHKHPNPQASLPLTQDVPMTFRVLPEYIIEDPIQFYYFAVQYSPEKFELSGKNELLIFALTFLSSTWYIKNPFLKAKILDALWLGIWNYDGRHADGILGSLLNSHPMALQHLMSVLTHFYIEVEQTGASSQFYDKFNSRRSIAGILKIIWNNPAHREALSREAENVDKFVRFVNLMINDVTYLMDESLGELAQIHNLQVEMESPEWASKPQEYRREREGTLRSLERHASGYVSLGRSTVELLKVFTSETKRPFMMPEIVDRLAAMLDYNLVALVGPKYQELRVKNAEKYRFNPKVLLADVLQVFINLSDQEEFVKAVANDGRSYSKDLFEKAADIGVKRAIKTQAEMDLLTAFVGKVEIVKATMEIEEEEMGDVPDDFLDPLMYTLMRDPVILPTSKTTIDRSTIKSHLLSDTHDPFNRAPLKIEDVFPDTELKARIDAWLAEKRAKKTESAMQVDS
ncbi:hypothetical protein CYLTODRAFT_493873 [Cylindrobasidium torrendii FP15055 ss-10]|uniref:RING-type E3 ubiquitin transferase n=1 Tax=Cylindrobasidium torrendii FP15055 ss-10 TaxID=1314674 RepID=A0A0D7AZ51_9AGAR|nr:hypothetical protein CYLTODRAFT_493873 [Cylindrobasidium torrendii FP15055 ss-10]